MARQVHINTVRTRQFPQRDTLGGAERVEEFGHHRLEMEAPSLTNLCDQYGGQVQAGTAGLLHRLLWPPVRGCAA